MIYIRRFSVYNEIGLLDCKDNTFSFLAEDTHKDSVIKGVFEFINKCIIVLFSCDKKMKLKIDTKVYDFLDNRITILFSKHGKKSTLLVLVDNNEILNVTYEVEYDKGSGVFWADEEEDVDFGLWLFNVVNNKERFEILRLSW